MKASELRIGNLVLMETPDGSFQKWKDSIHSVVHYDLDDDETGFSGIPLTEEWLVRMGFVDCEDDPDIKYYKNGTVQLNAHEDLSGMWLRGHGSMKIKYVHQLQNLYFALTGEELKYENTN